MRKEGRIKILPNLQRGYKNLLLHAIFSLLAFLMPLNPLAALPTLSLKVQWKVSPFSLK